MQKLSAILVDGTVYFSWLFIVSMGLTLIYGVMKILNIAHGSFYALGAYTAASAVGAYFAGNYPAAGSFLVLIAAGIAVGAAAGFLVERGLSAADVWPRRDRAGSRHLRRLPDLRGSHQARLGRRSVFCLPALRAARAGFDQRHRLRDLRFRPARPRHPARRCRLVGSQPHAPRQAPAGGDPRPRDQHRDGHQRDADVHRDLRHRRHARRARRRR